MKRLLLAVIVAIVSFASQEAVASVPKAHNGELALERLVAMIAESAHWNPDSLIAVGLEPLVSKTEHDEECGDFEYFVHGRHVQACEAEGWSVTLTPAGRHAVAIEVTLTTDNATVLYFKEKADHDAFIDCARRSSRFRSDEYNEAIGLSLIESDECKNGWYVITLHGG
ncbi:MAG: hypothetical protein IJT30_11690 [Muribaculaceae bacterium]|nr:hypothetical protein [Muribaculaceae bacterium]